MLRQLFRHSENPKLRSGSAVFNVNKSSLSSLPEFLEGVALDSNGQPSQLNHLIMVAGHAITISEDLKHAASQDSTWYLLPYQRNQGIPQELAAHIRAGAAAAAADPAALLVFSGGATRRAAGPGRTEAASYWRVAERYGWWGHTGARARAVTEDHAADSFLNLLYSICRFREVTGRYPQKITAVSYSFKQRRFSEVHRAALRFPKEDFSFLGVVPQSTKFDLQKATEGESQNALTPYLSDPYGCNTDALSEKRKERNPFFRQPPYLLSCPEIAPLLQWCGPQIYQGYLPWSSPSFVGDGSAIKPPSS